MSSQLLKLLRSEDGTSVAEFSLFVGIMFLAAAGFIGFSATRFNEAVMTSYAM